MSHAPRNDSVLRATKKIYDIALLNPFTHFITWTISPEHLDRTDPKLISKKLKTFLNHLQQRNNACYLVVPEYHKDGISIHIHGLISGNFRLVNSGKHTCTGQPIFNMPEWSFGFSTCIPLYGNRQHVASYITKYISKDFRKIFGHFYYAGGDIRRTPDTVFYDADYNDIHTKEYKIESFNLSFKYLTMEGV